MKHYIISFICLLFFASSLYGQNTSTGQNTGVGIGIYPTGTDVGIGFRSGKNSKWFLDARATKASLYNKPAVSSFTTEVSGVCRIIKLEKVRFHMGLGIRNEWNSGKNQKIGAVVPIGVEAFPFSFQNAGLFFEVAPYFTHDLEKEYNGGLRTVAGFVFYFPTKDKQEIK